MKLTLLLLVAFACHGGSIYAPGQTELAIYQFDGSVSGAFAPDWSGWAALYNQQPNLAELPRYGIYNCSPYCPDFTGLHFAAYGPALTAPPTQGGTETPEPATWSLLLGAIGCFGIARVERRKA